MHMHFPMRHVAVCRYTWGEATGGRAAVMIALVPLLAAFAQQALPYHVPGVESNDALYSLDPAYCADLGALTSAVVEAAGGLLGALSEPAKASASVKMRQTELACRLVQALLSHYAMDDGAAAVVVGALKIAIGNDKTSLAVKATLGMIKARAAAAAAAAAAGPVGGPTPPAKGAPTHRWAGIASLAARIGVL